MFSMLYILSIVCFTLFVKCILHFLFFVKDSTARARQQDKLSQKNYVGSIKMEKLEIRMNHALIY